MTFVELQPELDKLDAADKRRAAVFLIQQLRDGDAGRLVEMNQRHRVIAEGRAFSFAPIGSRRER